MIIMIQPLGPSLRDELDVEFSALELAALLWWQQLRFLIGSP